MDPAAGARGSHAACGRRPRLFRDARLPACSCPVTLGADAIRVLAVRDYGIHAVTASIVVERALGAVAVVTAALLSCALMAYGLTTQRMTVVAASLGTGVAVLAAAFLASLWLAARWGTRQGAAGSMISQVATAYAGYRRHPMTLVTFLMLSMVESSCPPWSPSSSRAVWVSTCRGGCSPPRSRSP